MCNRNCMHVRVNGDCGVGEDPKCCEMFIDMDEYDAYIDKLMAEDNTENSQAWDCHYCLYPSDENCAQCYGEDIEIPF